MHDPVSESVMDLPVPMQTNKHTEPWELQIWQDLDTENPLPDDGVRLVSFGRAHRNSKSIWDYYLRDDEQRRPVPMDHIRDQINTGTVFELSYYEHGDGCWFRRGTGYSRGLQCRFDTVQFAGLLFLDESFPETAADGRARKVTEWVDSLLEIYNNWCNGHCWGYTILNRDGDILDSCGGFIGDDSLRATLKDEHSKIFDGDTIRIKLTDPIGIF